MRQAVKLKKIIATVINNKKALQTVTLFLLFTKPKISGII